jgi:hypothetical protein
VSPAYQPAPEERIGLIVDERYRIVNHIASGGMAAVYRAEHIHNRVPVAIKVLHPEFSEHQEIIARFQREVQASRRIVHPHVVAAADFGRLPDGCMYMVLEFIQGVDLLEFLYRVKPIDQVRAVKIALQVALALVAAHAAGVVHRDLKPDNIMLIERDGDPDFVKVVDFGIAKMPTRGQALTTVGSVFGTPDYMAPEQARGGQIDHRSDLYTLGVVLYEMLAGTTPFANDNVAEIILAQIMKPPPPLPSSVDPALAELVLQLLAKEPAGRVQTSIELAQRLRGILARLAPHHPVLASSPVRALDAVAPVAVAAAAPAQVAAPPSSTGPFAVAPMSARVVSIGAGMPQTPPLPQAAPPPTPYAPPAPYSGAQAPYSAPIPNPVASARYPGPPAPYAGAPASLTAPGAPQNPGPAALQPPPDVASRASRVWIAFLAVFIVLVLVAWVFAKLILAVF